mmetsp:Transcript_13583/g.26103  ORF Transcript_13583/g.26103 Transcript_13583/m.26103 type:complete len:106 (-) Transcript_13583:302-619(-)
MYIRVRSCGGGKTVTLVVHDSSSAYDVLHDPHLREWPVPEFYPETPVVVKHAATGQRIFQYPELNACDTLSSLFVDCPGSLLELSWSQDGNIHVWVSYPSDGEFK